MGVKQKFNQSMEQDNFRRIYSRYYRMDSWESGHSANKMTGEQFKDCIR